MSIINKLRKIVHRKEWQRMDDLPANTGAGFCTIKDPLGVRKTALFLYSAILMYLYQVEDDALVQLPSPALAGTFGAGTC